MFLADTCTERSVLAISVDERSNLKLMIFSPGFVAGEMLEGFTLVNLILHETACLERNCGRETINMRINNNLSNPNLKGIKLANYCF
ncbi:MAG: hypothetical protein DRN78_00595 [Thermoproteota archaeon]|nr:MAG: hypothetical protein DRN78_00595 [Candidatus Korarchaeota archaeon]